MAKNGTKSNLWEQWNNQRHKSGVNFVDACAVLPSEWGGVGGWGWALSCFDPSFFFTRPKRCWAKVNMRFVGESFSFYNTLKNEELSSCLSFGCYYWPLLKELMNLSVRPISHIIFTKTSDMLMIASICTSQFYITVEILKTSIFVSEKLRGNKASVSKADLAFLTTAE